MTRLPFLEIKNWSIHQHYKDRNPPWIKFYGALLDDPAFLALPETSQAQLLKLWLLASRMGHPLPNDPKLLAGKIGTKGRLHLDALIASGCVIPCEQKASAVLAKSLQEFRPLSTEDREQRAELETDSSPPRSSSWQPARAAKLSERLTTEAGRTALTAILQVTQSDVGKVAIVNEITMMLSGDRGTTLRATPEQMDQALSDYVANGMSSDRWNAKHFAACVRSAMRPHEEQPANGKRLTNTERALASLQELKA